MKNNEDFYKEGEVIDEIEGWPNEDRWRYEQIKCIVEFAERFIPKNLGFIQMNHGTFEA